METNESAPRLITRALVHPVFRRILPGAAASALGDGMSAVAIAWLALKLAPAGSRGLWAGRGRGRLHAAGGRSARSRCGAGRAAATGRAWSS